MTCYDDNGEHQNYEQYFYDLGKMADDGNEAVGRMLFAWSAELMEKDMRLPKSLQDYLVARMREALLANAPKVSNALRITSPRNRSKKNLKPVALVYSQFTDGELLSGKAHTRALEQLAKKLSVENRQAQKLWKDILPAIEMFGLPKPIIKNK